MLIEGINFSSLIEIPFQQTNVSEDMIWAKQALEKGWTIIRDPSALVYHYHHQTFNYNFKATYVIAYEDNKIFGVKPAYPSVIIPFLKKVKRILKNNKLTFSEKLNWVFHNLSIYLSQFLSVVIFRGAHFFGGDQLIQKSLKFFCKNVPQGKQS